MVLAMAQPWKHPKNGTYYYRRAVPAELRDLIGKREIKRTLGTKCPKEARQRFPTFAVETEKLFAQARMKVERRYDALTPEQAKSLAADWYDRKLRERELEFVQATRDLKPGARAAAFARLDTALDAERDVIALVKDRGQQSEYATHQIDEIESLHGLVLEDASRKDLANSIIDAWGWLLSALWLRAKGDYSRDTYRETLPAAYAAPKPCRPLSPLSAHPAVDVDEGYESVLEAWKRDQSPAPKTFDSYRRRLFALQAFTDNKPVSAIEKADVLAWKRALTDKGLHANTVADYIACIKTLFERAERNELIASNPAKAVEGGRRRKQGNRRPYDDATAALILRSAWNLSGAKKWVPWFLAYTGARMEEVCQLTASDVQCQDGIWFLDINARDGKALKNRASARRLPLHPELIRRGALDLARDLPADAPLFPDLKPGPYGKRGETFTKRYGRWVRGTLGIEDKGLVAHSWRHRFKDQLREVDVAKTLNDALTGHSSSDVGDQYGRGYSLRKLSEAIEKLPVTDLRTATTNQLTPVENAN